MREIWYKLSGRSCPDVWMQYGPEAPPRSGEVTELTHNGSHTIWTTVSKWLPLGAELVPIDLGISGLVEACNWAGYPTEHSCSSLDSDHIRSDGTGRSPYICFSREFTKRQQDDVADAAAAIGVRYRISHTRGTRIAVYFTEDIGEHRRSPHNWDERIVQRFVAFGLALGIPITE